jgi:hypothetical protein
MRLLLRIIGARVVVRTELNCCPRLVRPSQSVPIGLAGIVKRDLAGH